MVQDHQEFEGVVTAVATVGARVEINGEEGFVDQVKHPSWWSEEAEPPKVGDRLHVVVLDASRTPPRLSALSCDIENARQFRRGCG
ncbi:S1 RNA-binding domain-containing protein [Streptomyces bluensis]